jgi:hypothetical protein
MNGNLSSLNSMARDTNNPKLTAKKAKMKLIKAALFLSAFQDHLEEKLLNDRRFVLWTLGRRKRSKLHRFYDCMKGPFLLRL